MYQVYIDFISYAYQVHIKCIKYLLEGYQVYITSVSKWILLVYQVNISSISSVYEWCIRCVLDVLGAYQVHHASVGIYVLKLVDCEYNPLIFVNKMLLLLVIILLVLS